MKPILFNTEMVRAILEGRKTVTRRAVKFKDGKNPNWTGYIKDGLTLYNGTNEPCNMPAPYQVNDVLYVRETFFQAVSHYLDVSGECVSVLSPIFEYLADGKHKKGHWYNERQDYYMVKRPSIHMPKEAARIFLRVTDVRVERLQDMTLEDFFNEGISIDEDEALREINLLDEAHSIAKVKFRQLWDSTIKKDQAKYYSWSVDPYVWVIEFEDISNQKDQLI